MSEIQKVKSFIDSIQYHEKTGPQIDPYKGRFPFITISRQAGAGGQALADELIKKIRLRHEHHREILFSGWQLCNQELCHMLAQDPNLKTSVESLRQTEYHSHAEDMISQLIYGGLSQDHVVKKMFRIMRTFAIHGKVIFVGRGSTFITRDLPYGIHVRLEAPLESRVKRMMEGLHADEKKAREIILEKDKAKADLVKTFFHKDIRDPLLYDVVWNTDRITLEEIAEILIGMIQRKVSNPSASAVAA